MPAIEARYPDLLSEPATPDRRRIVSALAALATTYAPPPDVRASLVKTLRDHAAAGIASQNERRSSWLRMRSRRSVLLAAALIVAAIAGTAAATGAIPLTDQALAPYPNAYETGIGQIVTKDLGVHLNVSRSVCGFNLHVTRVYADTHEVVVAYTLNGPSGRSWNPFFFYAFTKLTDARGDVLPFAGGQSTGSSSLATSTVANGNYTAYDISQLGILPKILTLRLTVQAVQGVEVLGTASPVRRSCETYVHTNIGGPNSPYGTGPTQVVRANGATAMTFSIPTNRRVRAIPIQRAVKAAGVTLTLKRADVTPIGVRLSLQGTSAGDFEGELSLGVTGNRKTTQWECSSGASHVTLSCDAPLYDYHGPVTLTIKAVHWVSGKPTLPGGPWTFHFTMP